MTDQTLTSLVLQQSFLMDYIKAFDIRSMVLRSQRVISTPSITSARRWGQFMSLREPVKNWKSIFRLLPRNTMMTV